MGYYINENSKGVEAPAKGKFQFFIDDGARVTKCFWQPNLICIVHNVMFEAAGYCYSEQEMKEFARDDGRPKSWLVYEHAKELSGYNKYQ